MKTCLVFLKNGEIIESKIKNKVFSISEFNYECYKMYDNIILLYNESGDTNITNFYFTDEKFKNDVMLLKVNEDGNIINFKITDYIKNLNKIDDIIESDCDFTFNDDDLEHLMKEPFEY